MSAASPDPACLGKLRFVTPAEAHHRRRCQQQRRKCQLWVYRCPWCHGYHLTSGPREVR